MDEFMPFQKIGRLSREIIITEKIDGTNALVQINEDGSIQVGSRSQWIFPEKGKDNYGFAQWVFDHKDELIAGLGIGRHFGEWWGQGIQRKYGLTEKRFSLFNTHKWGEARPACCHVVPVLYRGDFDTHEINTIMNRLAHNGSVAAPGFMQPEGVVIYHAQANVLFKKTFDKDDAGKGREPISYLI